MLKPRRVSSSSACSSTAWFWMTRSSTAFSGPGFTHSVSLVRFHGLSGPKGKGLFPCPKNGGRCESLPSVQFLPHGPTGVDPGAKGGGLKGLGCDEGRPARRGTRLNFLCLFSVFLLPGPWRCVGIGSMTDVALGLTMERGGAETEFGCYQG